MSRHRDVRNLTQDDYYDDYDDYDDDNYDEGDESNDDYYYHQQSNKKQQVVVAPVIKSMPAKQQKTSAAAVAAAVLPQTSEENVRLLMGMGFAKEQAETALLATKGDVRAAVDLLLGSTSLSSSKPTESHQSGITKPPAGFGRPLGTFVAAGLATQTSELKAAKPFTGIKPQLPPTAINKPSTTDQPRKDYGPLPKIPPAIQQELANQQSRLSMVVLGHVDAGKSTLMGQVLLQMGQVQQRTINKYQKQATELGKASFALAWVMDEDTAERERGVTMEVATKSLSTAHHDITVLDAPGHADFVPSMITGAAAADVGLLVIAATMGEFEAGFDGGGQTREHIILARGLGVSQLIVAVNKLDLCNWSQVRLQEIQQKLTPFLIKSGFASKRIKFVPISGLDGTNVKEQASAGVSLSAWYRGPTLLAAMDSFLPAKRNFDKPLRIIISDVFSEGKGVTVKCRIAQGVVQVGDKLVVLPIGDDATVSKIEHSVMTGESTNRFKYAIAGDTTDIVLLGIDMARLSPGNILSHPHWELRPPIKKRILCKILVMDDLNVPIIRGANVLLHMHSIDVPAVLTKLISTTTRDGLKENPRALLSGASASVEITLKTKVCVEAYNDCRALGRFVLRRGGDTVAVGIVEQVPP